MYIFHRSGKQQMKLEEVTSFISKLRLPTALVFTPTNLSEEKKKFFNSDIYEPHFKYRIVKNNNREILQKLSSLKVVTDIDPRLSNFYIELIESKKESNELMHAVGDNELVSEISYKKYGRPSPLLFRNSARILRGNVENYNIVKAPVVKDGDKLQFSSIEEVFKVVFDHFGLTDWRVQASSNIPRNAAKVGIKSKWVLVDPNIQKSKFKLKKTLIHEVGTHVFRAVNGLNSGIDALSNANLISYLDVEEGLATWNESEMGLLTLEGLKRKAALTYAIYVGERLPFRELYNNMLSVFPKNSAFDITYRVKRGLGDTSYPGIYGKDIVYYRGFRKVRSALEKDKSLYEKLYAGKINIEQCQWVDEGLIPKGKIIPSKQEWNTVFKKVNL